MKLVNCGITIWIDYQLSEEECTVRCDSNLAICHLCGIYIVLLLSAGKL
jgi:hypothetical protein